MLTEEYFIYALQDAKKSPRATYFHLLPLRKDIFANTFKIMFLNTDVRNFTLNSFFYFKIKNMMKIKLNNNLNKKIIKIYYTIKISYKNFAVQ